MVGDEGRLVGDHMIRCASLSNEETCARSKLVGHKSNGVRRRVVEKGNDKLWKLHCVDTLWVNGGRGVSATGGDGWEVRAQDVDRGMRGAWVNRDNKFTITVAINFPLIFPFVIKFVARVVAVGFCGCCKCSRRPCRPPHRKCSRRPCRPPIVGRRIRDGGWSSWWGWCWVL